MNIKVAAFTVSEKSSNINDQEWNMYNTTINNLNEVTLKDFKFKLNNKIPVTKTFLHKIKKSKIIFVPIVNRNQKQFYI